MIKVKVARLVGVPILTQLRIEEVLLRRTGENWLLLNKQMPGLAIVLGFSGKVEELVEIEQIRKSREHVELIRRYTGGGTVIVDKHTIFTSFIMNSADVPACKPFPRDIMNWSRSIFAPVFANMPTGATFDLRDNDYILNNLKIGGNAQTIIKDRWVHHTSFLWDYLPDNMRYLQMPKKQPEYRKNRSHLDFLDKITKHIGDQIVFEERLLNSVNTMYEIEEISFDDLKRIVMDEDKACPEKERKLLIRTKLLDHGDYY